jgi:hypothetical protein
MHNQMQLNLSYVTFQWNIEIGSQQQSAGRQCIPLRHIILIPSQPVFDLTP